MDALKPSLSGRGAGKSSLFWHQSDEQFHHLYPLSMRRLANRHWTPLEIAQKVAQFLSPRAGSRILDIGSGVGKFCLTGAFHHPGSRFYGIEQRAELVGHANTAKDILRLQNVEFTCGNFTQLDFNQYDHFYFYNSFYEHLTDCDKIDQSITFSSAMYNYYNRYLYKKLDAMPAGTRLATFHTLEERIPPGYCLAESHVGTLLRFWIKT